MVDLVNKKLFGVVRNVIYQHVIIVNRIKRVSWDIN